MNKIWSKVSNYFKKNWVYILIFAIFLIFDQITKVILDGKTIGLISGVFSFTSSHNYGAGFSILTGKGWLLITLTFVFLAFIGVFNHFQKQKNALYKWSMALIISGAIGNLIDRIFLGYVRDFLYFELINFPIFNVADSCLTIGIILLCVFLVFVEPKLKKANSQKTETNSGQDDQSNSQNKEENNADNNSWTTRYKC